MAALLAFFGAARQAEGAKVFARGAVIALRIIVPAIGAGGSTFATEHLSGARRSLFEAAMDDLRKVHAQLESMHSADAEARRGGAPHSAGRR